MINFTMQTRWNIANFNVICYKEYSHEVCLKYLFHFANMCYIPCRLDATLSMSTRYIWDQKGFVVCGVFTFFVQVGCSWGLGQIPHQTKATLTSVNGYTVGAVRRGSS